MHAYKRLWESGVSYLTHVREESWIQASSNLPPFLSAEMRNEYLAREQGIDPAEYFEVMGMWQLFYALYIAGEEYAFLISWNEIINV